jgi:hypothetical protein
MGPVRSNALWAYAASYRDKWRGAGVRSTEGGFPSVNRPTIQITRPLTPG